MDKNIALRRFEKWNRKVHIYLGLYMLLFIWLFSISGLSRTTGDPNTILVSIGPRLSLDLPPYMTARIDWGFQMKDSGASPSGASSLLHASFMVSY